MENVHYGRLQEIFKCPSDNRASLKNIQTKEKVIQLMKTVQRYLITMEDLQKTICLLLTTETTKITSESLENLQATEDY